jgi:hypothetical protein
VPVSPSSELIKCSTYGFADIVKVKMKRILVLAIILAFVMIPLASSARTAITDTDLDTVTAQSGVNIDFTNFKVNGLSVSTISWGDSDGVPNDTYDTFYTSGYNGAGYFGVKGVTIAGAAAGNSVDFSGSMNIDVGTSGTQTRMQIALPQIVVGGSAGMNIVATLKLDNTKLLSTTAGNLGANLAIVTLTGFRTYLGGTITVYAH